MNNRSIAVTVSTCAIALLAVLPATTVARAAEPASDEKSDSRARLDAGEIIIKTSKVEGSGVPRVKAMGVVDAAPEAIWAVVERCADYKKTMIRTADSEEVSRKGNVVRCRVTIELPFPLKNLTATTDAIHTVVAGKKWQRRWSLVDGDYKRNTGSWTLIPFDDSGKRTLVIYEVHAEPNVALPDSIQRLAQKKSLPDLFEHLRETIK
ncbi:MAG: SRPBCC family protein [Myxococcota bacterium]